MVAIEERVNGPDVKAHALQDKDASGISDMPERYV